MNLTNPNDDDMELEPADETSNKIIRVCIIISAACGVFVFILLIAMS